MGKYRVTQLHETKEELIQLLQLPTWNFTISIMNTIAIAIYNKEHEEAAKATETK